MEKAEFIKKFKMGLASGKIIDPLIKEAEEILEVVSKARKNTSFD